MVVRTSCRRQKPSEWSYKAVRRTIAKAEKPGVDVALVALDALAFNVHLGFCGHDGFDIVGLGQGVHVQIIIHHEQTVLKVGTSKAAGFDFLDTLRLSKCSF